jgi:hypothetical protein
MNGGVLMHLVTYTHTHTDGRTDNLFFSLSVFSNHLRCGMRLERSKTEPMGISHVTQLLASSQQSTPSRWHASSISISTYLCVCVCLFVFDGGGGRGGEEILWRCALASIWFDFTRGARGFILLSIHRVTFNYTFQAQGRRRLLRKGPSPTWSNHHSTRVPTHHVPPAQQLWRAVFPVRWPRRITCFFWGRCRCHCLMLMTSWWGFACALRFGALGPSLLPSQTASDISIAYTHTDLHAAVLGLGVEKGDPRRHLQRVGALRVEVGCVYCLVGGGGNLIIKGFVGVLVICVCVWQGGGAATCNTRFGSVELDRAQDAIHKSINQSIRPPTQKATRQKSHFIHLNPPSPPWCQGTTDESACGTLTRKFHTVCVRVRV